MPRLPLSLQSVALEYASHRPLVEDIFFFETQTIDHVTNRIKARVVDAGKARDVIELVVGQNLEALFGRGIVDQRLNNLFLASAGKSLLKLTVSFGIGSEIARIQTLSMTSG